MSSPLGTSPSSRRLHGHGRQVAALFVLAALAAGCSSVTDRVDNVRSTVGGVTERARVCVDLAQTFAAIENEGAEADPEQALAALAALRTLAERSPEAVEELMEELETLVRRAEEIETRGDSPIADPEFRSAAQRVASRAVALCATG